MEIDVKALTQRYLFLRGERAKLKKAFDMADEGYQSEMAAIEVQFVTALKASNLTSMRTDFGTVILSPRTRYWASDWEGMYKFMKENDALYLMERRIHASNMAQFLEEHPGMMPPGLNIDSQTTATVRAN